VTVAEIIAELQRHPPYKPVRIMFDSFIVETEVGEKVVMGPQHAIDVDVVTYEGSHVEIRAI
jgi:hypothetical protein